MTVLHPVLPEREQRLRARTLDLLKNLSRAIDGLELPGADDDRQRLLAARARLERCFLLVVAGDVGTGKSSLVNALLGSDALPMEAGDEFPGATLLRHGIVSSERMQGDTLRVRTHPAQLLREAHIVEIPIDGAALDRSPDLERGYLAQADLILLVTSAQSPFTSRERSFLERVRRYGGRVVLVVNKLDLAPDRRVQQQAMALVRQQAVALLGETARTFGVSATRDEAVERVADAAWRRVGLEAVGGYIMDTLNQPKRFREWVVEAVGLAREVADRYRTTLTERLDPLTADTGILANIEHELSTFRKARLRELEPRLRRIDAILEEMEQRGDRFFETTMRAQRVRWLFDSEAARRSFDHDVIGATPVEIEKQVQHMADWLVGHDMAVRQEVWRYLDTGHRHGTEPGDSAASTMRFDPDREALLDRLQGRVTELLQEYDRQAESRRVATEVRTVFAATTMAEFWAAFVVAAVMLMFDGAAGYVGAAALAPVLAAGGFSILPRQRRHARRRYVHRIAGLRERFQERLATAGRAEIDHCVQGIREAIAPYRDGVAGREDRMKRSWAQLSDAQDALQLLQLELR